MTTSADMNELAPAPFRQNRPLQLMALVFVAFWIAMAVAPVYPYDWWIENILVFATVMAAVGTYRWFRFSNTSYFLLLIFMMLHTYSAHYAYTQVPLPWLNELFGRSDRLNFDRFVHLMFGVLLAFPIWELLRRTAGVRRAWAYLITVMAVLAAGAFYELLEMWIAMVLAPDIGDAFVGTQGDPWDAQKDIALAMYGAVGALLVTFLVRRRRLG